jgi:hypothetical protein
MTTASTPVAALKRQADQIAAMLKKCECGEINGPKIEAARQTPSLKFGVIMDDKLVSIDMPWTVIRENGEVALSAYVLEQMRKVAKP